jgi:hypothetical protein
MVTVSPSTIVVEGSAAGGRVMVWPPIMVVSGAE